MKTVFILEDSVVQIHQLEKLLTKHGYEVLGTASTGPEAIEKVLQLKPDLVFVDIVIKGKMDGISAAEAIRKELDIPIIFTTNYSNDELVDRALLVSPYAYMLKPINEDQLRVTLETTKNKVKLEKEREKLIQQLYQTQKMEAIGLVAGGVAHNFNNILAAIVGNAEMIANSLPPESRNSERIERIIKSSLRARDLTGKLLALTRSDELDFKPIAISDVIENISDILKDIISKQIELKISVEEMAGTVTGDHNHLVQALLNVCINACDSMENGGTLTIGAREILLGPADIYSMPELKPGRHCHIFVTDTGAGISQDIVDRIFEPFFTTKGKEKGSGLGLYVTLGIIQNHGGRIEVSSRINGGTSLDIYIPMCEESKSHEEIPSENEMRSGNTKERTILVIDDETEFLDAIEEILKDEGYKTIIAEDGEKGLKEFERRREEIDLVLLDIMMPGMSGDEVFRVLKKMDTNVKVVLCSGFSVEGKVADMLDRGCSAFIQKPFIMSELDKVISNVLSA